MPRELLLPVPHAIADKLHHLIEEHALNLVEQALKEEQPEHGRLVLLSREFKQLANNLNDLGRRDVIGW